jgi:predicted MPP superfamily phosphohydrolase
LAQVPACRSIDVSWAHGGAFPLRLTVLSLAIAWCACSGPSSSPATDQSAPVPPAPVAPVAPPPPPKQPAAWRFVVLSDLHLPNHAVATATTARVIAAVVALHPRFVVITGDHTNGNPSDPPAMVAASTTWWHAVAAALEPLREAKIPVLPVAGNHDAYLPGQREHYAATFGDLSAWAAPLEVHGDRVPFAYSVDVDGVHLSLAHVVSSSLDPAIATWLVADLAAARDARLRIVFGHVPVASINGHNAKLHGGLATILEAGHADLYVAGHEHLVWDENVTLPLGRSLRQVLVGCSSGFYNYAPSPAAMQRAKCTPVVLAGKREPKRCTMPNGGGVFVLSAGRKHRMVQHAKASFTVITIDGDSVGVDPQTVDDQGKASAFYLPE